MAPQDAAAKALDSLLAARASIPADFGPISTKDGKGFGIAFYSKGLGQEKIDALRQFLSGNATSPHSDGDVLDGAALAARGGEVRPTDPSFRSTFEYLADSMQPLGGWSTTEHGVEAPPVMGWPGASAEEIAFTYFGWPYPPARSATAGDPLNRCAGITGGGVLAGKASPVSVLFTDASGHRSGDGPNGETLTEIPGSEVRPAKGESAKDRAAYYVPPGAYTVSIIGTGSGPATVYFHTGTRLAGAQVFHFDSSAGATGQLTIDGYGNVSSPLSFGGKDIVGSGAFGMKVDGMPASIPFGTFKDVQVKVTDAFGDPVPFASITMTVSNYALNGITDDKGVVPMTIYGPYEGSTIQYEVSALNHSKVAGKITVGPPDTSAAPDQKRFVGTAAPIVWRGLGHAADANANAKAWAILLLIGLAYAVSRLRGKEKRTTPAR
jgi:hypothetical protein